MSWPKLNAVNDRIRKDSWIKDANSIGVYEISGYSKTIVYISLYTALRILNVRESVSFLIIFAFLISTFLSCVNGNDSFPTAKNRLVNSLINLSDFDRRKWNLDYSFRISHVFRLLSTSKPTTTPEGFQIFFVIVSSNDDRTGNLFFVVNWFLLVDHNDAEIHYLPTLIVSHSTIKIINLHN